MWDSTDALELREIPRRLLIIGGGYIGMEMGTVYAALGSEVTVVEALGSIIAAADPDLVVPVFNSAKVHFHDVLVNTKVTQVVQQDDGMHVKLLGVDLEATGTSVRQGPGVGRAPSEFQGHRPRAHGGRGRREGIHQDGSSAANGRTAHFRRLGTWRVSRCSRTRQSYEGRVAAEVLAGKAAAYDPKCIPAVVFTDPELAWVGLTETEALNRNIPYRIAAFPWAAAGRATSLDRNDGLTKMIVDPNNELILGIGIVGVGAGELIAEGALAIEMGCTITDLKMTVHAHPTLSETVMESAEVYHGQSAHYMAKKDR